LRGSTGERQSSNRYDPNKCVTLTNVREPQSYIKAMADSYKTKSVKSWQEEM